MTAAVKILRGRPILSIRRQPKIIRINTGGQGPRGLSGREMLFADRNYYVRNNGSDGNTGLDDTAGSAFLTLSHALSVAASLDTVIYNVYIHITDDAYALAGLVGRAPVGSGRIIIVGNETTPSNVELNISVAGGHGIDFRSMATIFEIRGVKLNCIGGVASTAAINTDMAAVLFQNVNFGAGWGFHLRAGTFGKIEATGNYAISGGAVAHWRAQTGQIQVQGRTITITGTPAFTRFANCNNLGMMLVNSNTFSGAATGRRFFVGLNGVIQTSGAGLTYLPGDAAGVEETSTGGKYA